MPDILRREHCEMHINSFGHNIFREYVVRRPAHQAGERCCLARALPKEWCEVYSSRQSIGPDSSASSEERRCVKVKSKSPRIILVLSMFLICLSGTECGPSDPGPSDPPDGIDPNGTDATPTLMGLDPDKPIILPFAVQAAYNDDTMFSI